MIMHAQSSDRVRTVYSRIFKDIQAYSGILMNIQPHSQARKKGRGGRKWTSSTLFEIKKCVLILGRKALIVSIFGLNFPFKIQFQKYLGETLPKCFPVGPLFLVFLTKCLSKCRSSTILDIQDPSYIENLVYSDTFKYIL